MNNCKQNCELIDKICNTMTKRCVLKYGKIGKALLQKSPEKKKVSKKKISKSNCITRSKIPLKDHQIKAIEYINSDEKKGLLVVHNVGSGKTLTGVAASQCYLDKYPNDKVYVITPVSLQDNFKKEMIKYGADVNDERYQFYTITGFYNSYSHKKISTTNSLFILDEAHNIRNPKGKRTLIMIKAASKARKVLLLTATPIINSSDDIKALSSMVNQTGVFDKDVDIASLSCKVSYYYNRDETSYPKITMMNKFLIMSKSFQEKYDAIAKNADICSDFMATNADFVCFYNGVRRAVNLLENETSQKANWIIKKIKEANKKDKFVIFSHFLNSGINVVISKLKKLNIKYKVISGDISKEERTKIINKYNNDKFQVLFITKAGGEGIDLKNTKYVIILESTWNEATANQVIGRAVRYKSHETLPIKERHVTVYRLYLITKEEYKKRKLLLENVQTTKLNGRPLSIDLYLRNYSKEKEIHNKINLKKLKKESIEYSNKCI